MVRRILIYLVLTTVLLSGLWGTVLAGESDGSVTADEVSSKIICTRISREIHFDTDLDTFSSLEGDSLIPTFSGAYLMSSSEGYLLPYFHQEVPVEGDVHGMDFEFLSGMTYNLEPVPYPVPEGYGLKPLQLPDRANISADFQYDLYEEILSDQRILNIRVSPVEYHDDGTVTVYSRVRYSFSVSEDIPEQPDVLPGHKPTGRVRYLIITTEELKDSVESFADWKSQKGYFSHIETVEWISERYEGRDDPEKIRNYISEMVSRYDTEYLLLAGDYDDVPIRKTVNEKVLMPSVEPDYFASDIYYACVDPDTTWDRDNDGLFAESGEIDDSDLDILYGRLAIGSPDMMKQKLDELIDREKNPPTTLADDDMVIFVNDLGGQTDSVDEVELILERTDFESSVSVHKVYYDESGDEVLTESTFRKGIEESYPLNSHDGHGDPDGFQGLFYISDIDDLEQDHLGGYFFTAACLVGWFDDPSDFREHSFIDCVGEGLTETPGKGVVGFSGSNRLAAAFSTTQMMGDIDGMYELNLWASKYVTEDKIDQNAGVIHALSMIEFNRKFSPFNDPYMLDSRAFLSYNYLGDPEAPLIMDDPETLTMDFELSSDKGSIDVLVTNDTGVPQDAVNVTLYRSGEIGITGETGKNGRIKLSIPPNNGGVVNLTAYKAGDKAAIDSLELPDTLSPEPILRTVPILPDGDNSIYISVPEAYIYADEESNIEYRIGGGVVKTSDEEVSLVLEEGNNTIEVRATDTVGHASRWFTFNVIVDMTDPELEFTMIPGPSDGRDGWYLKPASFIVASSEELQEINLSIDGCEPVVLSDTVEIIEGEHTYMINGTDLSGRTSRIEKILKLDTERPISGRMELSHGPDGMNGFYVKAPSIFFHLDDEDAVIETRWDQGIWEVNDGSIIAPEGVHLLEWRTIDIAGNIGSNGSKIFKVDTGIPELLVTLPADGPDGDGGYYVSSPLILASSSEGEVIYSMVPLAESPVWERAISFPEEGLEVQDGKWTIYVKAIDEAGNEDDIERIDMKVDTIDPLVEVLITPGDPNGKNGWYNSPVVVEAITQEDGLDVEITTDGEDWTAFGSPRCLADGIYDVSVKAVDDAGNTLLVDIGEMKIDQEMPSVDLIRPDENELFGKGPVTLIWDSYDLISIDLKSEISLDRGDWLSVEEEGSYSLEGLEDGDHRISIRTSDEAGNFRITTVDVEVDAEDPTVVHASPYDEYVDLEEVILLIEMSEKMDRDSIDIRINGEFVSHYWVSDRILQSDLDDLQPGSSYVVEVTGKDVAGNPLLPYSFSFNTKDPAPVVQDDPVEEGSGETDNTVIIYSMILLIALVLIGILVVSGVIVMKKRGSI